MRVSIILLLCLFSCALADCGKYATREKCLGNCFCGWRTDPYNQAGKCVNKCFEINGVQCEINEGMFCDVSFFLYDSGLVIGCLVVAWIGLCVIALITFGIRLGCEFMYQLYQTYVWARYVMWMIAGGILCGLAIGLLYLVFTSIPMMITAFTR